MFLVSVFTTSRTISIRDYNTDKLSAGFTMRRPTWGILPMDIALSVSHEPTSGLTCALLLGCSNLQAKFLRKEVKTYAMLAGHPLLLPTLLTGYQQQLLTRETAKSWDGLLKVETLSGQTGVPVADSHLYENDDTSFDNITKGVLSVIQLTGTWESGTQALLLCIESVQESINYVSTVTPHQKEEFVTKIASILTERLIFLTHKSKVMLWDLLFINKRGQAQMTAVSIK